MCTGWCTGLLLCQDSLLESEVSKSFVWKQTTSRVERCICILAPGFLRFSTQHVRSWVQSCLIVEAISSGPGIAGFWNTASACEGDKLLFAETDVWSSLSCTRLCEREQEDPPSARRLAERSDHGRVGITSPFDCEWALSEQTCRTSLCSCHCRLSNHPDPPPRLKKANFALFVSFDSIDSTCPEITWSLLGNYHLEKKWLGFISALCSIVWDYFMNWCSSSVRGCLLCSAEPEVWVQYFFSTTILECKIAASICMYNADTWPSFGTCGAVQMQSICFYLVTRVSERRSGTLTQNGSLNGNSCVALRE